MSKVYVIQRCEIVFCDYPIENERPYGIFTDKVKAEEALLKAAEADMQELLLGNETSILLDREYFRTDKFPPELKKWVDDFIEANDEFPDEYEDLEKLDLSKLLAYYATDKFTIWEMELQG